MKHLFFLLISLSLFACTKHREIKIIGRNAVTGQGYEGLQYEVVSSRTGNDGEVYRSEALGNLNANGEAFVSIKQKNSRTYSIRLFGPSNSCYSNNVIQYFDSPYDVNGTFTFEFAECAYLKFRYNNISCFDSNDHIEVTRITNLDGYTGFYNPAIYNGCTDYTMPNFVQVPMRYWIFSWSVTKNGITNNFTDTVYLSPNEYKYYEFNY